MSLEFSSGGAEDRLQKFLSPNGLSLLLSKQALGVIHGLDARLKSFAAALQCRRLAQWRQPRADDIYIVSAPKTGTTWLQMITYQLATGGHGEFDHIVQVSPFYEALPYLPYDLGKRILETCPSPRILKTHLGYERLKLPACSKAIYITRSYPDSIVSFHHHISLQLGVNIDLEKHITGMLTENIEDETTWLGHMASWWPHRNDRNVLHVRYADLLRDLAGQVRRVADFCGFTANDEQMARILDRCSFRSMKQDDAKFDVRLQFHDRPFRAGFVRQGGEGAGKAVLSDEQARRVAEHWARFSQRMQIAEGEV